MSSYIAANEECLRFDHLDQLQIQGLINSIGEGRTDHFMSLISTLSCRGHTSGIDIGTGLSTALFTFCDRSLGTNLLSKVQTFTEDGNRQKDQYL